MEIITAPVGQGGKNMYKDTATVQELLNRCLHLLPGVIPLDVDGRVGKKTEEAIKAFQSKVVFMKEPDGRVDPGGKTLRMLNMKSVDGTAVIGSRTQKRSFGTYIYPLKSRSPQSYKTGMRRFGATRSGGRKHAGCDLYAPIGTPIYAMADGEVIKDVYAFYLGTYAIEVRHPNFVARYCELGAAAKGLKKGSIVKKGQLVGYVGKLRGLNMSMLHLELYDGHGKGPLTVRNKKPYQRRSDLIDPTTILDEAR